MPGQGLDQKEERMETEETQQREREKHSKRKPTHHNSPPHGIMRTLLFRSFFFLGGFLVL